MTTYPAQAADAAADERWQMRVEHPAEGTLLLRLSGSWRMEDRLPAVDEVRRQIGSGRAVRRLAFDTQGVTAWDTGLLAFVSKLREWGAADGIEPDLAGLPEGIRRLLHLADVVQPRKGDRRVAPLPWLARVGTTALTVWTGTVALCTFIGELFLALLAMLRGRARWRGSDLALHIQECGAGALPIVTLISFLVGLILAFVGAVQLRQFGAQIYVADLVGIAMAREMGAMMTAIIMAGRSGAAFAAQIGSMQANEEVDALTTLGLSPMEFLVLPRTVALVLMMPLLTLYADLLGILGGGFVGITMLGLSPSQYFYETQNILTLSDFSMGLVKAGVFGVLVALAGCLRGMQCGRSSAAVGMAVTSAVVTGIVFIVLSDALLTVVYNALGL